MKVNTSLSSLRRERIVSTRLYRKRTRLTVVTMLAIALVTCLLAVSAAQTTISFVYLAGAEATEERYRILTEAFERANPDIKVERMRIIDQYPTRLALMISTGTVPDIIALDMNEIMEFGDERILYELTPFVQDADGYEFDMIPQPVVDVFTVDGKLFAVPVMANPAAYAFNADLFSQSGLTSPHALYVEDDWTWDNFRDAARKLTRPNPDGTFAVLGSTLHLPRTWIFANGGREVDDPHRPTKAYYDTPEALEALHFLHQLIHADEAMRGPGGRVTTALGAEEILAFTRGQIGMVSRWLSFLPSLADASFEVGMVPYPRGPGDEGRYASDLGMFGLAISRTTENLEAAWRFVAFVTGPEGAEISGDLPGATPPRPVGLRWIGDLTMNPEVYPDLLVQGTLRIISRNRQDIQRIIDGQLARIWDNVAPVETVAGEITRLIDVFLAENPQ